MKIYSIILLLFASSALAVAQDFDADKAVKKASRNLSSYNLDPSSNQDKLEEARLLIEEALETGVVDNDTKAWYTYGTVYTELLNQNVMALVNDGSAPIMQKEAPSKIYEGFSKAYTTAEKNFEKRDAVTGLTGIMNNISYVASIMLGRSEFEDAYNAYNALVMSHDFLVENGEQSFFETTEDFQQQLYWGALSAYSAGDLDNAESAFTRLHNEGYDNPEVYSALVDIKTKQGDEAAADALLKSGLEKYPEDKGLLYAEINRALAKGDLEQLIGKLEYAMEQEPDNITIHSTLGHVYDQLYQNSVKSGDLDKAHGYFEKAQGSFEKALALDENYFDAIYMLGALEYNKAAEIAIVVNELAEDYSKEGTKKYEEKKTEMMSQFDKALPYFLKAEQLNGRDLNTLIALREIYARKDQLDKSNEYKTKIENLNSGN